MKLLSKAFLGFTLFCIVSVVNAASIDVNIVCPKSAYMNESIKCSINATQDNIFGVQAEFDFENFNLVSQTITSNKLFNIPNSITNKGFMVGNNNGLPSSFKIGDIVLKVSDIEENGIYKIGLKSIVGSSTDYEDIEIDDVYTSISLKAPKPVSPSIKVVKNSDKKVTITWDEVKYAKSYKVYKSTDGKKYTSVTVNTNSYEDTNVSRGYMYYYKVRSVNDAGSSTYSNVISYRVPLLKTTSKITGVNYNAIGLSWDKVSYVTGYQIYRSTNETSGYKLVKTIKGSSTTSYTNTSLSNGVKYYYKVRGYKIVNGKTVYAAFSTPVSATTKVKTPTVSLSKYDYKKLSAKWNKISGATSYWVYLCKNSTCNLITKTTSTSYKISNLILGEEYEVKVKACRTSSGKTKCGDYGYDTSYVAPSKTTISIESRTNSEVNLSLKQVSGATKYVIKYKEKEEDLYKEVTTYDRKYTLENLEICKTYEVVAYSVYEKEGLDIYSLKTSMSFEFIPNIPSNYKLKKLSLNSFAITWDSDEVISKYKIYRSTSKTKGYKLIKTVYDANEYVDTNIVPNETYYYKIKACFASYCSEASSYKYAKNSIGTPVINVSKSSKQNIISYNEINGVSGYQIYRKTNSGSYVRIATISSLEYIDKNVKKGNTYKYKVRAYKKQSGKTYYSSYSKIK